MNNAITHPFLFAPLHIWANYAWKFGELTLASSEVIAQRSRQLLWTGRAPTASDQKEIALMSQEKFAAAAESTQAMALGYMALAPQMAMLAFRQMAGLVPLTNLMTLNPLQLWSRQSRTAYDAIAGSTAAATEVSRSVEKIASKGLKPIHTRAMANARRLKRKTR